jgi:DNA invertase Pin-like site-specific DNA recombinase
MFHCYIRRSTASQSISPRRQLEEIKGISKGRDFSKLSVWEEEPVSGSASIADRPILASMIQSMAAGDTLFIASPSRLARSQMVYQTIVGLLHQKKVNIEFADGTVLDLDDSLSILLGNIMAFVSEHERKAIAHRTKTALAIIKDKKALGRPDLVKYGWRADDQGMLVAYEPEQIIIRKMGELASEGMSQSSIAKTLNAGGLRNRQGRVWNQPRVSQMLAKYRRLVATHN